MTIVTAPMKKMKFLPVYLARRPRVKLDIALPREKKVTAKPTLSTPRLHETKYCKRGKVILC